MTGIQGQFNRIFTISVLALTDKIAGKEQVIDDGIGIGPAFEQIIILEK